MIRGHGEFEILALGGQGPAQLAATMDWAQWVSGLPGTHVVAFFQVQEASLLEGGAGMLEEALGLSVPCPVTFY